MTNHKDAIEHMAEEFKKCRKILVALGDEYVT